MFTIPVSSKNVEIGPLIADMEQWVQTIKNDKGKKMMRSKQERDFRTSEKKRTLKKVKPDIFENSTRIFDSRVDDIRITTADKGNKTIIMS